MNADTFVFLVPISLFAMIFFIVKSVVENKTRQKAIEKGVTDEALKNLFAHPVDAGEGTGELKWGMVAIAVGLSLAAVQFMGLDPDQPLAFGLPLIFAGAALVLYQVLRPHFTRKS